MSILENLNIYLFEKILDKLEYNSISTLLCVNKNMYNNIMFLNNNIIHIFLDKIKNNKHTHNIYELKYIILG